MKTFTMVLLIAVAGVGALKLQTDHEELSRKKIVAYTDDPAEVVSTIVHDDNAKPATYVKNDVATVVVDLDGWSAKYQIPLLQSNIRQITPKLFERFPAINRIDYLGKVTLVDVRGHESSEYGVKATFTRQNAASIKWENVPSENMPAVADAFWVHPAISK